MSFDHGGYDPRTIDGLKAITTQSFSELNSKLGTQYEASFYNPSLAASGDQYIVIVVGDGHIIFKDIALQFDSEVISVQFFSGPTYTGGTEIDVFNMHSGEPVPNDVTLLGGATVTDEGTPISAVETSIGSQGAGNRAVAVSAQGAGAERILEPNSTYLFKLTNVDTVNAAAVAGIATWYQGPLSVDI